MLHVQPSIHTFVNTADVLKHKKNPMGLGIRVMIFKVGIGGLKSVWLSRGAWEGTQVQAVTLES